MPIAHRLRCHTRHHNPAPDNFAPLAGTALLATGNNRPVYWVARGIPVTDEQGRRVINSALHHRSFYDPTKAVELCKAFRAEYPDAIVVCEQPV